MSLETFIQQLTNGVSLGSLYALIAIGYTMVYGILRLINFAHSDIFMVGAYFAFYLIAGHSLLQMFIFTIILSIAGQFGDLIESALKRYYGVKDSGKILPGHGGILDRFDSLLFVLPMLHLLAVI